MINIQGAPTRARSHPMPSYTSPHSFFKMSLWRTYSCCHFTDAKNEAQRDWGIVAQGAGQPFELRSVLCFLCRFVEFAYPSLPTVPTMLPFLMNFFNLSKKSLATRLSLRLWQTPDLSRGERDLKFQEITEKLLTWEHWNLLKGQEIKKKFFILLLGTWKDENMNLFLPPLLLKSDKSVSYSYKLY